MTLPKVKHLKDKSCYNNNYYELTETSCEYFMCIDDCKIIYEKCEEEYNCYFYSFGHFDENGKFVTVLGIESPNSWKLREVDAE